MPRSRSSRRSPSEEAEEVVEEVEEVVGVGVLAALGDRRPPRPEHCWWWERGDVLTCLQLRQDGMPQE